MARKRMFRLDVLETDAFMEMPLTTQALYFHLNLRADDDGFIGNPNQIVKLIGAGTDDLKLLIAKRFVIAFEDGVIVIKHWRMHNTLSSYRYKETNFIEDKAMLKIKENKAYSLTSGDDICDEHLIKIAQRQTKDNTKTTLEEKRREEKSIDKNNKYICAFNEFWKNYPRKKDKARAYKCYCARLNDGYTEDQLLVACINYAAECEHNKTEERYIKHGATFLSVNEPFLDYLKGETGYVGMGTDASQDEAEYERQVREQLKRIESGEFDNENLWE